MTQWMALAWSLSVEVPIALALGRGVPRGRLAAVALAATLLTHPFAIAMFEGLRPVMPYAARALLIESMVALVEGGLYWRVAGLSPRRALAVSGIANATSYLTCLALRTWVI